MQEWIKCITIVEKKFKDIFKKNLKKKLKKKIEKKNLKKKFEKKKKSSENFEIEIFQFFLVPMGSGVSGIDTRYN